MDDARLSGKDIIRMIRLNHTDDNLYLKMGQNVHFLRENEQDGIKKTKMASKG